jgi:predicted nuclease of restriction endonuclease-like (RecB) superfamily
MAKKQNPPKKQATKPYATRSKADAGTTPVPSQIDFDVVLGLIDAARARAVTAVNTELIDLYWSIGKHISLKTAEEGWGQGTVEALAGTIRQRYPTMRGYSARNLWRMSQFYETYRSQPNVSTLLKELSWSHHLAIMSRCKRDEEREFYLRLAGRERWSFRELQRQLAGALFERTVLAPPKLSTPLAELHPEAALVFKDSYLVEFLDLPSNHSEDDLEEGLIENLKQFLIELGRDFCFVGSQYPLQVGGRDFALDLLFFQPGAQLPRRIRTEDRRVPTGASRAIRVLSGGSRPRREEAARGAIHRSPALRHQGPRSRRIRFEPSRFTRPGRRVPDPAAGQGASASQTSRVLRARVGAVGTGGHRRSSVGYEGATEEKPHAVAPCALSLVASTCHEKYLFPVASLSDRSPLPRFSALLLLAPQSPLAITLIFALGPCPRTARSSCP